MRKASNLISIVDFVNVVIEQLIDEVDVRKEHAPAAIPSEAQLIEDLTNFDFLRLAILIAFAYHFTELFPFVCDHFTAAEASHRNYHRCCIGVVFIIARPMLYIELTVKSIQN